MSKTELEWLQNFYHECCNGDWEHTYGIKVDTLDNPGWSLDIDLNDTTLESMSFDDYQEDRSDSDWFFCKVKNRKFQGRGGPHNLVDIINIFRQWVEECDQKQQMD